jgi:hypothetical protein
VTSPVPLALPNSHFSICYTLTHFTPSYSTVIFEVGSDSEFGNDVSYSRALSFDPKAQYPTWYVCRSTVNLGVELVAIEKSRVHIWAYTSAILTIIFTRQVFYSLWCPLIRSHKWGNSSQEATHWQQGTINLSIFAGYKIKLQWQNQLKETTKVGWTSKMRLYMVSIAYKVENNDQDLITERNV